MKKIYTASAPEPIGPYSQAILKDRLLFCSGQIPIAPATGQITAGGVAEQTDTVCRNLKAVLEAAGLTFDNVVKTTCFLAEPDDFAEFNKVYSGYFVSCPARSCVFVKALPKGVLVEVELIAAAG